MQYKIWFNGISTERKTEKNHIKLTINCLTLSLKWTYLMHTEIKLHILFRNIVYWKMVFVHVVFLLFWYKEKKKKRNRFFMGATKYGGQTNRHYSIPILLRHLRFVCSRLVHAHRHYCKREKEKLNQVEWNHMKSENFMYRHHPNYLRM